MRWKDDWEWWACKNLEGASYGLFQVTKMTFNWRQWEKHGNLQSGDMNRVLLNTGL